MLRSTGFIRRRKLAEIIFVSMSFNPRAGCKDRFPRVGAVVGNGRRGSLGEMNLND